MLGRPTKKLQTDRHTPHTDPPIHYHPVVALEREKGCLQFEESPLSKGMECFYQCIWTLGNPGDLDPGVKPVVWSIPLRLT